MSLVLANTVLKQILMSTEYDIWKLYGLFISTVGALYIYCFELKIRHNMYDYNWSMNCRKKKLSNLE